MPGVRWDSAPTGLMLPTALVGPIHPSTVRDSAVSAQFRADFCKVACPKTGTLKGFTVLNGGTVNGNLRGLVYDATRAALLWDSGSVAMAGATTPQAVGDPNIQVKLGDVLWFARQTDSATATFARLAVAASGFAVLPAAFATALGGEVALWGQNTPGSFVAPAVTVALTNSANFHPLYAYIA